MRRRQRLAPRRHQMPLSPCLPCSRRTPVCPDVRSRGQGLGVVAQLVNRDDITDECPLLYAWNKLPSSPSRPDLAEREAILFVSVLSNHVILCRRIRQICRAGNLRSASILIDCQGSSAGACSRSTVKHDDPEGFSCAAPRKGLSCGGARDE